VPQAIELERNGVDTAVLFATLDAVKHEPELGRFQFRVNNRWINGVHSQSTIKSFYGAGSEDTTRTQAFVLDTGEPQILHGDDEGPNPGEYLLHALASCLTNAIVNVAAARRVDLRRVESHVVGDLDARGALGISEEVRNGFERVRVSFIVEGDAPEEKLRQVVERGRQRSAVYDMVTNGVPVVIEVATPSAVAFEPEPDTRDRVAH
jgi:uncharacterized OsmC-like protein